jgi:hypothetical protein
MKPLRADTIDDDERVLQVSFAMSFNPMTQREVRNISEQGEGNR